MKLIVISLLLIITFQQVQPFIIKAITSIYQMYQIANDAHDTYSKVVTPNTQDLMDEILSVKDDVNQVTKDVSHKIDELYTQLVTQLPRMGQINRGLETFSRLFNRISYLYKNFERLIRGREPSVRELREFAKVALSYFSDSVGATLDALHELFVPSEVGHLNDGLLLVIAQSVEMTLTADLGCSRGPPPEEQLYLIYTALLAAEIRGFMMQSFTYLLLENLSEESYINEIEDSRLLALIRINEYMWEVNGIIKWTARTYYPCDPPEGYKRNVTFAEFEKFMSAYVVFQYTALQDCRGLCNELGPDIWKGKTMRYCENADKVCPRTERCTGHLFNCVNLGENNNKICLNPDKDFGSKRYVYLKDNSIQYGNESQCVVGNKITFDSQRIYQYRTDSTHRCDYCLCTCIEDTPTSPYRYAISLRPQVADFANNKIVAGARFRMIDHVLHLQIQQGLAQGDTFLPSSLEWLPLATMQLYLSKADPEEPLVLVRNETGKNYMYGEDYKLVDYFNKDFNFDELVVPEGYVVTGARLIRGQSGRTQLLMHATPYDFINSKVNISDEKQPKWIQANDMYGILPEYDQSRAEIKTEKSTSGVDFTKPSVRAFKPNTWLRGGVSNLEGDLGGTFYPLIDIRDISTPSLTLLEGMGLIYKRPEGSDVGYMALSLRAASRDKFLEAEVTSDDLVVY